MDITCFNRVLVLRIFPLPLEEQLKTGIEIGHWMILHSLLTPYKHEIIKHIGTEENKFKIAKGCI